MTAAEEVALGRLEPPRLARIAGWSERLIAALVDAGVLLVLGAVLGMAAGAYLPPVGWTKLVGLLVGAGYLGIGASRMTGGQTAGMSAVGLVLVGRDGKPRTILRSTVRAALVIAPWCLSAVYVGAQLPRGPFLAWTSAVLTYGVVPASILLFFLPPGRRQFLHDVVADCFLVLEEDVGRPVPAPLGPWAVVLPALWIAAVGAAYVPSFYRAVIQEGMLINHQLRRMPGIAGAEVVPRRPADGAVHVFVFLGVRADAPACPEVLREAVHRFEEEESRVGRVDRLSVSCIRGWNNGLLHWLNVERLDRQGGPAP